MDDGNQIVAMIALTSPDRLSPGYDRGPLLHCNHETTLSDDDGSHDAIEITK